MSLILNDVGAIQILKKYFAHTMPVGGNNLTLRLFVNNYTPVDDELVSAYIEATGGGYAAQTMTPGNWTVSMQSQIAQARHLLQPFIFTGPLTDNATVYGYYITDADNNLICGERSQISFTPMDNGDAVLVIPVIMLSKGTPT